MIGVLSDSQGDLDAFDAAYELLRLKGARRFIFAGGRYSDFDAWIEHRGRLRSARTYSDADFLVDVTNFLAEREQVERPPAFDDDESVAPEESPEWLRSRFLCVADRHCREERVPRKSVDLLGDLLCCIVHDKNALERDDLINARVFIHGACPEPKVVQIGPRFFVTPGALAGGAESTCGFLELDERNLRYSAFRLDGHAVIDRQVLVVDRRTKVSVK